MSCDPDQSDLEYDVQRFPEAAFYEGDLTEQVGDEQTTFPIHIELYRRDDGLYNFSIGDVGTDIQHEPQYLSFYKLNGVLVDDRLSIVGDNVLGMINADQFTFSHFDVVLTAKKATVNIQFDDNKSWHCEADAIIHMLE
jgi:hypothetical protein